MSPHGGGRTAARDMAFPGPGVHVLLLGRLPVLAAIVSGREEVTGSALHGLLWGTILAALLLWGARGEYHAQPGAWGSCWSGSAGGRSRRPTSRACSIRHCGAAGGLIARPTSGCRTRLGAGPSGRCIYGNGPWATRQTRPNSR